MSRTARSKRKRLTRAARLRALGCGLAGSVAVVLLASQPTRAQSLGAPGLMRYDLKVREGASGRSMRVVGNVAMLGGTVLVRHCLQPHPFAPMLCQLTANGDTSPPMPMPPDMPMSGQWPGAAGPWSGLPGAMPGPPSGYASPTSGAGVLDRLLSPPPGVPGWQMQARGSGTWMGYAAEGSFSYWQPLH